MKISYSSAFAKCARSRDFLRSMLRIASKVNQPGWAVLSHDFSKLPSMEPRNKVEVSHHRDRRKKSPGVSASVATIAWCVCSNLNFQLKNRNKSNCVSSPKFAFIFGDPGVDSGDKDKVKVGWKKSTSEK